MKNKFIFLAFLALGITFGNALRCYECSSDTNENCISGVTNETVSHSHCGFIPGNHHGARYQCAAFSKRDDNTRKTTTIRKCVIKNHPRESNFCTDLASDLQNRGCTLVDCKVCEEDYCNSGEKINGTMMVLLGLLGLIGLGKL